MSFLQEEKVVSENQHETITLKELDVNESILFYFDNLRDATSDEYGDFKICQGLKLDLTASNEADLLDSAVAASFIPNTLLTNKLDQNSFVRGEVYRVEHAWTRGQKFSNGQKAKGEGYELYRIKLGEGTLKQLAHLYKEKCSTPVDTSAPEAEEAPAKRKVAV